MPNTPSQNIDLTVLREEIRPAIKTLADKLTADLADNLLSITIVGSVLTDDFHPKKSDINTAVLVKQRSHQLLELIASYGREMGKRRLRAPILLTPAYIQSSLDVFVVEFLDYQLNHLTILGKDPFADLQFDKEHLRLQCERTLKTCLIQLRQGYISTLGKPKLVAGLLLTCMGDLIPLLRAMLFLVDADRTPLAQPTLIAASAHFQFDIESLQKLLDAKQQHKLPAIDNIEILFEKAYQTIDNLSKQVDNLTIKATPSTKA